MKITVAKRDLETALRVVKISTGSNDIQSHYVFRTQGNQLRVYSYNGRIGASSHVLADVESDVNSESFTLDAKKFNKWLSAAGDETITMSKKDTTMKIKGGKGTVTFRSLDPDQFPFWDKIFEQSVKTAKIESTRLVSALDYTRQFVSANETEKPDQCITEVKGSAFWATTSDALSTVKLNDLRDSKVRIHGKDIGVVKNFLNLSKESVEIHEHTRSTFFRHGDGSILSVSKPSISFVELNDSIDNKAPFQWTVNAQDLSSAIRQISAVSSDDDSLLHLQLTGEGLSLSMVSESGDRDSLSIPCSEEKLLEEVEHDLPDDGWSVSYTHLESILSMRKGSDDIKFGLCPVGEGGGFTVVSEDFQGDQYDTILVWAG